MKHGGGGKKKPAVTDEKPADPHGRRDNLAGLTLFAVLGGGDEVSPPPPPPQTAHHHQSRPTLLDALKDDPNSAKENKKTWKHFKEKLGLKGAAWTSTAPIPASDVPIHPMSSRTMSRRVSNRFPSGEYPADEYKPELAQSASRRELRPTPSNRMSLSRNQSRSLRLQSSASIRRSGTEGEEESERGGEDGEGEGDQSGMRMSLMALLEESEGGLMMDEEEEEEEEGGCEDYGGEFHNCCVCMVRHKGEPFVPCGHTFCRLCSRELWAEKGNCPLCNNFILEILDIF